MARRLVEQGVPFVEVDLGGWDTHANNFTTLANTKLPELDKAMARWSSIWPSAACCEDTAIIWMGEFGRTPRINGNSRPRPLGAQLERRASAVRGMKGGMAVGRPTADGTDVDTEPYTVAGRDGLRLQGARHFARHHLHQPQRPPDEDRQQRQGDQRAVRLKRHNSRRACDTRFGNG